MSLLDEYMTSCTILNKITDNDPSPYGGIITQWVDGAVIKAAFVLDTSIQAKIATTQGVTGIYTIVTPREITLGYHDVVRRDEDGKIFRVTSRGEDRKTPQSTPLNMRAVSAEEWSLPSNGQMDSDS